MDSGVPQRSAITTVNIHVPLNKPPKLPENLQFSVDENTALDVVIGRVIATDPDDLTNKTHILKYSIKNEGQLEKLIL